MGIRRHAAHEHLTIKVLSNPSKEDLDNLYAIDINAHISPWSYDGIKDCFTDNTRCVVLYLRHEMIGFAIFSLIWDEAELYTIGIIRKYQGLGFGHHLLLRTLQLAHKLGANRCFLEVRVSNAPAIYLYDLFGFEITGSRKNYYPATSYTPAENAYTMACDLTQLQDKDTSDFCSKEHVNSLIVAVSIDELND